MSTVNYFLNFWYFYSVNSHRTATELTPAPWESDPLSGNREEPEETLVGWTPAHSPRE